MGASFPTSAWDGDSAARDSDNAIQRAPDAKDWGRLISEVAATQTKLGLGAVPGTVGSYATGVTDVSGVYKTVLTITNLPITCAEGGTKEYGSALIFTFPAGAIKVLGATQDLILTSTDYAASEEGDFALGSVAATDQALTGTDVTWSVDSAALTFGSGEATLQDQSDHVAIYNGTSTPGPVYLNLALDQGGGTGDVVVNGTITILWSNLGDY